jgi:hypothetical protein
LFFIFEAARELKLIAPPVVVRKWSRRLAWTPTELNVELLKPPVLTP